MTDTVCACAHWQEEHGVGGCDAPGCRCSEFQFDPKQNTPEAIAWRGGED